MIVQSSLLDEFATLHAQAVDDRPLGKQQARTIATVGRLCIAAAGRGRSNLGEKQAAALCDLGLMELTERPNRWASKWYRVTPAGRFYAALVGGRPRFVGKFAVWVPDFSRLPTPALEVLAVAVDAELRGRR